MILFGIVLVTLVSLILFLITGAMLLHKAILKRRRIVDKAEDKIRALYAKKYALISPIIELIRDEIDSSDPIFGELVLRRKEVTKSESIELKDRADLAFMKTLHRLAIMANENPVLKENGEILKAKRDVKEIDNEISRLEVDYNAVTTDYNDFIAKPFVKRVASIFNFNQKGLVNPTSEAII